MVRPTNISSVAGSPVFTLFDAEDRKVLDTETFARLAGGTLAAVRISRFFTEVECRSMVESLESVPLGSYDEKLVQPRIGKLGPTIYDFYGDSGLKDEYWLDAERATDLRARLLPGCDPLDVALDRLSENWPRRIAPATVNGKRLFAGLIREISEGARMHFDEIAREMPFTLDATPVAQLAFNCHLSTSTGGGDAQVFRRRWRPDDESRRDGYGYDRSLVDGEPAVEVRADVGDAVLFDPRNYHAVTPCSGQGRRITLSFFIGLSAVGELFVWS
jgi:hypothetical protein